MRCQSGALLSREPSFSAEQPLLTGSGLLLSHTTCVNSQCVCFFFILEVIEGLSPEATTRGKEKTKSISWRRNGDVTGFHAHLEVARGLAPD